MAIFDIETELLELTAGGWTNCSIGVAANEITVILYGADIPYTAFGNDSCSLEVAFNKAKQDIDRVIKQEEMLQKRWEETARIVYAKQLAYNKLKNITLDDL